MLKRKGGGFHIRPQAVPLPHTVRAHIVGAPAETQTKMTAFHESGHKIYSTVSAWSP